MKLNQNDSKIVKILLELGMKEDLSKNPDAVSRVLEVAHSSISGLDINNPEHEARN